MTNERMSAGKIRELNAHLTDEQFAELLMGATPAAIQQHLSACAECSDEAERVAGAIGSFERASRQWAERRAQAMPALNAGSKPLLAWASIVARPQAWAAAALAVAVGVGAAISVHRTGQTSQALVQAAAPAIAQANAPSVPAQQQTATVATPAAVSRVARVTPSRLRADNELLSAINGELRADATPADLFGLDVTSHAGRDGAAGRVTN